MMFQQTWLGLLEKSLNDAGYLIYSFQKKGLDTNRICEDLNDTYIYIKPELIILQIGIVDCSPRALKESEVKFLQKIPIIRNITHKIVKRYYRNISSFRNLCYVELEQFQKNLEALKNSFKSSKWCVLPIGLPCDGYLKKSPLIADRIFQYNKVIQNIFQNSLVNNILQFDKKELNTIYLDDFYHLNEYGHKLYFNKLQDHLENENIINS